MSKGVERHPLERHHYNLQKFPGPSDPGYQAVEDAIVRLANGARKYLRECSTGKLILVVNLYTVQSSPCWKSGRRSRLWRQCAFMSN